MIPFLFLTLLLLLLLRPSRALSQEELHILHASDLHFISPEITDNGSAFTRLVSPSDGKVMLYSSRLIDAFISQVRQERPDLVILSGDLTFNGAPESHRDLARRLGVLTREGIPVHVIPGNHDLNCPSAAHFSGTRITRIPPATAQDFLSVWEDFGYRQALFRDSGSLSYSLRLPGRRLAVFVDVNTPDSPGALKSTTLNWIRQQMDHAREHALSVLLVTHQPILAHNALFTQGFQMKNSDELTLLADASPVPCILGGHMHIQNIRRTPGGIPEILASALSVYPLQYGLLTLGREENHYETRSVDVSRWAREQGLDGRDLMNFMAYALNLFVSSSITTSAARQLISAEHSSSLLTYLANLNKSYFSGNLTTMRIEDPLFQELCEKSGFWSVYARSMAPDFGQDYRHLNWRNAPCPEPAP